MASEYLEIVQMENGDIVLQRPLPGAEPLVMIRFSRQVLDMLGDDALEIAEAMMEAAADAVGELDPGQEEDGWELIRSSNGPVLH